MQRCPICLETWRPLVQCPCPGRHMFCIDCQGRIRELECPLCRSACFSVANWLLEAREQRISYTEALLHWQRALRHGHTGILLCLHLQDSERHQRWNLLGVNFGSNSTCVHMATASGHAACVSLLCSIRAEVDARDDFGETALHRSLDNVDTSCLQMLLTNLADAEKTDEAGTPPIVTAAAHGNELATQCLLQARACPGTRSLVGETALMASLEGFNMNIMEILLRSSVNVDDKDDFGETALHLAVRLNHVPGVELLIAAHANCNAESRNGHTPLSLAHQIGDSAVVEILRVSTASYSLVQCQSNSSSDRSTAS